MKWGEGSGGTGRPGMGGARRAFCTRLGVGMSASQSGEWVEMVA